MEEIEQLETEIKYQNKWMTVREDKIRRQSGATGIFGVVEKPDFVVILPVQDGYIYLVEQYRYPVGARFMELPQGAWEDTPNVDHLTLALAELREETGLVSKNMVYLGHQYLAYGYSTQGFHTYLATELEQGLISLDEEEEGLITKKVKLSEFEGMILSGKIKDATTVNAYGLARLKGLV